MIDGSHEQVHEAPIEGVTPRRRLRRSSLVLGIVTGMALCVLGGLVASVVFFRDPLPDLTDESLNAAMQRWQKSGLQNYMLQVEILGRQPGIVELTVQNGEPTAMTRDGRTPRQRRTWAAWTVPSQFDMLVTELRGQQDPARGYGAAAGSEVVLQAEFDPNRGYPLRVRRQVLGTDLAMEWRVTRFQELEPRNTQNTRKKETETSGHGIPSAASLRSAATKVGVSRFRHFALSRFSLGNSLCHPIAKARNGENAKDCHKRRTTAFQQVYE